MQILVTGANGFIGSQVVARLIASGHHVTCCVRSVKQTQERFPDCSVISCNFNTDTDPSDWTPRLQNIDAVVNCVGILQSHGRDHIAAIHQKTPCALFKAAERSGVKKVIHISALGAADDAVTAYGRTKHAADEFLRGLNIDSVILRPSLVYGTGSHGGTSLFRGMSALPWIVPVVGKGDAEFQPIFIEDLAKSIDHLLSHSEGRQLFNALGPDRIPVKKLLLRLRRWLGLGKAIVLKSPVFMIRMFAKMGDLFTHGPINTTAIKMLLTSRVADPEPFRKALDFKLQSFDQVLLTHPSQTQDLWHARLYFIRPLLRLAIGLLWLLTGVFSITLSKQLGYTILSHIGMTGSLATVSLYGGAVVDIILGALTLLNWRIELVGALEIIFMVIYSLIITFTIPSLWWHPFGPVLKNIPIIVATLFMMALAREG